MSRPSTVVVLPAFRFPRFMIFLLPVPCSCLMLPSYQAHPHLSTPNVTSFQVWASLARRSLLRRDGAAERLQLHHVRNRPPEGARGLAGRLAVLHEAPRPAELDGTPVLAQLLANQLDELAALHLRGVVRRVLHERDLAFHFLVPSCPAVGTILPGPPAI